MGTLVCWRYPTTLFAGLADHTYVSCGTGKRAWGCWGGKVGGNPLGSGQGSTAQADAIAEPNERARITCYLINGVCHQSANRILSPARFTARGARGYWVSEALYGTYGRPRGFLGVCKAPFHRHQNVTGDLPECVEPPEGPADFSVEAPVGEGEVSASMEEYLDTVTAVYEEISPAFWRAEATPVDVASFQLTLFSILVEYKIGRDFLGTVPGGRLQEIRLRVEEERYEIEEEFNKGLPVTEFVDRYNELITRFQHDVARTVDRRQYEALFELNPGEDVVLGDPRIAEAAYADREE